MEAHRSDRRPASNRSRFSVQDLGGDQGCIVIDSRADRAHSLNGTAVSVWTACDGTHTVEEVATSVGLTVELTHITVDRLVALDLVDDGSAVGTHTRRAVLNRTAVLGGAALAVPVINSLALPSLAAAQSAPFTLTVSGVNNEGAAMTYTIAPTTVNPGGSTGTIPYVSTIYVDTDGNESTFGQPGSNPDYITFTFTNGSEGRHYPPSTFNVVNNSASMTVSYSFTGSSVDGAVSGTLAPGASQVYEFANEAVMAVVTL